ncbi:hypothetical protein HZ326_10865 [Fusarium oxysporum f. sp. albedinis]|nr:hypothetical protein HZ326_10865 [Fusarium oxysporum f. sp. albedinis]
MTSSHPSVSGPQPNSEASWRNSSDGRTERFRGASRGKGKVGMPSFRSSWITAAPADAISFSVVIVQPVIRLVSTYSLLEEGCLSNNFPSFSPHY